MGFVGLTLTRGSAPQPAWAGPIANANGELANSCCDIPWGCMEPVKCPFWNPVADEIEAKNDLWYARWDRYPVSKGHLLVIPFRHTPDFSR